jgi:hypothetical protein
MKLRAHVRRITGATTHSIGRIENDMPVPGTPLPGPTYVEIVGADGAFYLFRYNDAGEFGGDTWHQSIEEAQDQAKFEYEIEASDWSTVED